MLTKDPQSFDSPLIFRDTTWRTAAITDRSSLSSYALLLTANCRLVTVERRGLFKRFLTTSKKTCSRTISCLIIYLIGSQGPIPQLRCFSHCNDRDVVTAMRKIFDARLASSALLLDQVQSTPASCLVAPSDNFLASLQHGEREEACSSIPVILNEDNFNKHTFLWPHLTLFLASCTNVKKKKVVLSYWVVLDNDNFNKHTFLWPYLTKFVAPCSTVKKKKLFPPYWVMPTTTISTSVLSCGPF